MICFPNAKINIGLNITEKRLDGFHNIETIFYPIELCDMLEFVVSDKISFENSGLTIDGDADNNLCIKAYNLLKKDFSLPELRIHLHKIIPFGAGLGGGSADAAFMLNALNSYFELNLSASELKKYASSIGSDCAFFIENKPSFANEKGDNLQEIKLNLKDYLIVIVKPNIHVPTAVAYSKVKPAIPSTSLKDSINLPIEEWKYNIKNDFEESIFAVYPEIKSIKENLYKQGAIYASMSGSGSSVYGIFHKKENPEITFPDYFIWSK